MLRYGQEYVRQSQEAYLGFRRFRAAQAARFTQFFNASISFSNSVGCPDIGLMVAFRVALRSTATIWRNDHSLSHSPIAARSSSASGNACPAVTYHTMMTLCSDHTHGATFSTASRLYCCGASRSKTCLLARNSTSMAHRQANWVTTHSTRAPRSVVNR